MIRSRSFQVEFPNAQRTDIQLRKNSGFTKKEGNENRKQWIFLKILCVI